MATHLEEIKTGQRFEFGANWSRFLSVLNDDRIATAEASLRQMLELDSLEGKSFLDIGSGSGLFSLSARRLGATVHSFDFDPESVACALELKRRYFEHDDQWTIEEGSALDTGYIGSLGEFDIVYSWGVLHHTGDMWSALSNAAIPVADGGRLFVSIYNDQGTKSKLWKKAKQVYCGGPLGRAAITLAGGGWIVACNAKADLVRLRSPFRRYAEYRKRRGMSAWHDIVDWLGGYPFEVARPEEIFDFYHARGFELTKLTTDGGGSGTNQYVFKKFAS